jgi:DNA-binding response OmpR family regulator
MLASLERRIKILIVDDNPLLVDLIAEMLSDIGNITVHTASDGIQGLELFDALHPDCMIIDVKMPGLNGYQLVRAIRGDPASEGMPMIILTAMTQDQDLFAGLAAGADHYLVKPVKPDVLMAAIQSALALSVQDRQNRLRDLTQET